MKTRTNIFNKLHQSDGMSFLIVLVAFLVAAMVSATIVAAAFSNAKQQIKDEQTQQDFMVLQSSAEYLASQLDDVTINYTRDGAGKYVPSSFTFGNGLNGQLLKNKSESLKNLLVNDTAGSLSITGCTMTNAFNNGSKTIEITYDYKFSMNSQGACSIEIKLYTDSGSKMYVYAAPVAPAGSTDTQKKLSWTTVSYSNNATEATS